MSLSFLYWLGLGVGVVENQHVYSTNILNLSTNWELKAGLRQHFKGEGKTLPQLAKSLARSLAKWMIPYPITVRLSADS